MAKGEKRPPGRPLAEHTDTERLDLLVKLVSYGRKRADVSLGWGGDNGEGALELHAGPARSFQAFVAEDAGGDLRRLLDRALSPNAEKAPSTKRVRRVRP